MTKRQLQILQHTIGADEFGRRKVDRNHFVTDPDCDDGKLCESLVAMGLMESLGPHALAGGSTLYRATQAGRDAVARESPKPPKVSKSKQRYLDYLNEDSGMTFGEWLKAQKARKLMGRI